jgi:hypothetical protein
VSGISSIPVITDASVSPFFGLNSKAQRCSHAFLEVHKQNANHQTQYLSPEYQRTEKRK